MKNILIGILSATLIVSALLIDLNNSNVVSATNNPEKIEAVVNQTNQTSQLSSDNTNKKTLTFEKDMTAFNSISLPSVVGDIKITYTDTQILKVSVEAIVEGNDESYQNSMLSELTLKSKAEAGELELAPYRGDHKLYESTADYDRKKCNVILNYTIQLPRNIKNINLSSTNGTINFDTIQCEKLNINTVNGKIISNGINAKEISLNTVSSDMKVSDKILCDNMKVNFVNGNIDMNQFEGMLHGEAVGSTFSISKADLKDKSNINHVGQGNITFGINSMNEGSSLSVKSYSGDVNLKVNENAKCTINSNKLEANKKETKTFNGGGPEINVELIGGKLVL